MTLEDSTTYQATIAKGEIRALRSTILRLGTKKFGVPTPETVARVESLNELTRLQELSDRLLDVAAWGELLAGV